jgi:hypothetical protein
MKYHTIIHCAVVLVSGTYASAQFAISSSTIDSGGGTLTGATYTLSGTIGQTDPGVLTGASYTLDGGFWPTALPSQSGSCEGDANGDNVIDVNDISYVLFRLGGPPPEGDANNDGAVDVNDISYVLFRLGDPC